MTAKIPLPNKIYKKAMKRSVIHSFIIFSFIISIFMLSLSFSSCGDLPSEEDVIAAAKELIPKSVVLNEIYFGKGLPYKETAGDSIMYATVSDDAPYKTEEELREATLETFTENYSESIFSVYLKGYSADGSNEVIYARYVQYEDRLTVNTKASPMTDGERTYDLDSVTVKKIKSSSAVVAVDSFYNGNADVEVEITLKLVEIKDENGNTSEVWRIDSPTY